MTDYTWKEIKRKWPSPGLSPVKTAVSHFSGVCFTAPPGWWQVGDPIGQRQVTP